MNKALVAAAVIGTLGYGGYRMLRGGAPAATDDTKLVLDRLWIDHLPRNDRDPVQVFVALTEQPIGAFQRASAWKGEHELFQYTRAGDALKVVFPQDGQRETLRTKARPCREGAMDYCLELDGGSRGVKKYYSREDWVIGGVHDAHELARRTDALVEQLVAEGETAPAPR